MSEPFARIESVEECIGYVCSYWNDIHYTISIIIHLAISINTETEITEKSAIANDIMITEMSESAKINVAKSLIHQIPKPLSKKLYKKSKSLLNFVDGPLRTQRNRFVHDVWYVDKTGETETFYRHQEKLIIKNIQSHKSKLDIKRMVKYDSFDDLLALVWAFYLGAHEVKGLRAYLAMLLSEQEGRPAEHHIQLPPQWSCKSHYEQHCSDKRLNPTSSYPL